jgi:hypothetical protein
METRTQRYFRSLVMVSLAAVAMGGLLFAQGQTASVQGRPDQGQEAQILVAHGLAMAIEGSTLDLLAMQRGRGASTGTDLGGTGTGAGGTVTRAPYGSDEDFRPSDRTAGAVGAGTSNPAGLTGRGRVSSDPWAVELHRHAMQAFEASDRLIKQAPQGDIKGPASRFQVAAVRYATTLRLLSELQDRSGTVVRPVLGQVPETPVGPSPGTGTGALATPGVTAKRVVEAGVGDTTDLGRDAAGGPNVLGTQPAVRVTIGAMPPSIVVLNHAVKEALDSLQVKQMVRLMGPSDSPARRALLAHARDMETKSLVGVESVLSAGKSGSRMGANAVGTSKEAGGQGGPISMLAMQASDVVMAISELTRDQPPVGKAKREGSGSVRSTSKPKNPEKP